MPVKATWAIGESVGAADMNAVATQVNTNTTDIAGRQAGVYYATIAALKAATTATVGHVYVSGYYVAGDGGGGDFRWDTSDITSTDNGGTIITPSGGLSSSGRWKRAYEGEVNARWFGVNPSQTDNTGALQKCVTWVGTTYPCGGIFIPSGDYQFTFDVGASGLSTITIGTDNVLIRGEGKATQLTVNSHARPNQLNYFFTFSKSGRGQGGGVKDLHFNGHSMLKWGIYLNTWRDAEFHNISAFDVHAGILDAEATNTTLLGESIDVRHLDCASSAGTSATQYGVRFRAGSGAGAKTWSDCWIENSTIISCWDSGVVLDGVERFQVRAVVAANNGTFTDTIDGSAKTGCLHTVRVTNSDLASARGAMGYHTIDGVYLESQAGGETPTTNVAVLIDTPTSQNNQNRFNRVANVVANGTSCGLVRFVDDNGFGRTNNNEFKDRIVTSIASSATPAINVNEVRQLDITALAVPITSMTSGLTGTPMDGDLLDVRIKDNGTARAIAWGSMFTGTLLTTTVVNQTHLQRCKYDAVAGKFAGYYADTAGY